jgi:hypothetical protein
MGRASAQKGPDQREADRLSRPIVIEGFDQLTDAEHITQQQKLVSVRNRRHPAHEIPGELPFFIRQLGLLEISVQMSDQRENERSEPRIFDTGI